MLGGAPNSVEHAQTIFDAVKSRACTSNPMTASQSDTRRDYIGRMKTALFALLVATTASAQSIDSMIDHELPSLLATYKTMHQTPELSCQEDKTSARVAARLRELGYTVADHVGEYIRQAFFATHDVRVGEHDVVFSEGG